MPIATSFVKYTLFFFNSLCFIGGLILTIWGAKAYGKTDAYFKVYSPDGKTEKPINIAVPIIAFGALVLLVSFLGCFGAIKRNKCMLMSYSGILFLLLAIEIGLCVYSLKNSESIRSGFEKGFEKSFSLYDKDDTIKKAWNTMQKKLKCCGINGYEDWKGDKIPKSCCRDKDSCPSDDDNNNNRGKEKSYFTKVYYTEGCQTILLETLSDKNITISAIIIGFIQLIGIIFACCLAQRDREKSYNTH